MAKDKSKRVRKRAKKNPLRDNYTEPAYRPYTLAVGQVAAAWNDLFNGLANLFWSMLGAGFSDIPLAAWNSLESDRTQVKMLRAVVAANFRIGAKERADMDAMLVEVNNLIDIRNNIVHAPLASVGPPKSAMILPGSTLGHPRAKRLEKTMMKGVRLLDEFRWCRDASIVLRDYCFAVDEAVGLGIPWPGKLELPVRPSPVAHRPRRDSPR